jgi:hypothetical protein
VLHHCASVARAVLAAQSLAELGDTNVPAVVGAFSELEESTEKR